MTRRHMRKSPGVLEAGGTSKIQAEVGNANGSRVSDGMHELFALSSRDRGRLCDSRISWGIEPDPARRRRGTRKSLSVRIH